jgi:hypothetical protein
VHFENYRRCLDHWLIDYTQPASTQYDSPLTALLQQPGEDIQISYQQHDEAEPYARTTLSLQKVKKSE